MSIDNETCFKCKTNDFLPLKCKVCEQVFCSDHFRANNHECVSTAVATGDAESSSITKEDGGSSDSSAAKVKSIFASIENRHDAMFADDSGNQKLHTGGIRTTAIAESGTIEVSGMSSATMSNLDKLASGSNKEAAIATKTRDILLKGKAVGVNKEIAVDDRFYVVAAFAATLSEGTKKCIFCNAKTTTIGDLCEWIARKEPMLAFRKVMRPEGQSVYISTSKSEIEVDTSAAAEASCFENARFAEYDRRALVSSVFENMQELRFHQISSSAAAAAQALVAEQADEAAARRAIEEQAAAEETALQIKAVRLAAAPKLVDSEVAIGDSLLYCKNDIVQLVTINSIHLDDYPNLYFTISYLSSTGELIERQTTVNHLQPLHCDEVPAEEGGFTINVTHGSKTYRVGGVGPHMNICVFKVLIQKHSGVAPKNQKLICKGAMLRDTDLVKDTKLTPGCKISMMGKK